MIAGCLGSTLLAVILQSSSSTYSEIRKCARRGVLGNLKDENASFLARTPGNNDVLLSLEFVGLSFSFW